jgi:hypothetical protein
MHDDKIRFVVEINPKKISSYQVVKYKRNVIRTFLAETI